MSRRLLGFSLIELIAVIVVVSVISVFVYPRFASSDTAAVQAGRDSLVAALFFAQQTAMSRAANNQITAEIIDGNLVQVEDLNGLVGTPGLENPVNFLSGVSVAGTTTFFTYDKLGRITNLSGPTTLTLAKGGVSAVVTVEASGYVHY